MTPCRALVVAVAVLAPALACRRGGTPGVTKGSIVLGISAPLSGPAAAWGTTAEGAVAWAQRVNAHGGVHGRRIEVMLRDDAYVPGRAVAHMAEMRERALAVVLLLGSATIAACKTPLIEAGVPIVWPLGNPAVWAGEPRGRLERVFVVYPEYGSEGRALGAAAVSDLGCPTLGALYQDDDYGRGALAGLRESVAAAGGRLVAEVPYDPQDRDMGVHARRLAASGAVGVALFATPTHAAATVREMDRLGFHPRLLGSFTLGDPQLMFRLLGPLWENAVFASNTPPADDPAAAAVVAEIVAAAPSLRGREGSALHGALAMMLTVEALERAGPHLTRGRFAAALETIRGWSPGGIGPPISFGPDRHHGRNALRLLRAVRGPGTSFALVAGVRESPPLF